MQLPHQEKFESKQEPPGINVSPQPPVRHLMGGWGAPGHPLLPLPLSLPGRSYKEEQNISLLRPGLVFLQLHMTAGFRGQRFTEAAL